MPTDRHLILYHAPHSRSAGARMLLEELNADYTLHPLNFKTNEQRAPAYLEINPMGKVPALRHGDVLITEQAAVYMYAAELYAQAGLSPAVGDPLRGPYLRWMVFYGSCLEPALVDRSMQRPPAPASRSPYGDFDAVILQKNFLDDRLTTAFNFTYAPEWRYLADDAAASGKSWQEETDINFNFAVSYRFAPNWSAGVEFVNEREYNSYRFRNQSNGGYYFGPTIHYGGKNFFVTATFLEQLPWASAHSDTVDGSLVSGRTFDNDFEKYRVRIKMGYYF
ncbi:glutathione S-transferase [Ralstonia solanacearum]|uniref:glutathione S-transferase n=1 Tax=Ralstonia solanacearum TaxID=305 RepID=UPI0006972F77|nr:glutathione S-transferase [Ralstonia solanacearum]AMP75682.1 hypothetical protein RALBFv3_12355 [Ralstonia solanacearum]